MDFFLTYKGFTKVFNKLGTISFYASSKRIINFKNWVFFRNSFWIGVIIVGFKIGLFFKNEDYLIVFFFVLHFLMGFFYQLIILRQM